MQWKLDTIKNCKYLQCGLYHSRSKQRTDQRILVCVITLKFFALGKPVFPRKKILPKKCLTFFYLYTLQLFSRPIEYFQKNIKLIFVHENIKNGPQKLPIIGPKLFSAVLPGCHKPAQNWRLICFLICGQLSCYSPAKKQTDDTFKNRSQGWF